MSSMVTQTLLNISSVELATNVTRAGMTYTEFVGYFYCQPTICLIGLFLNFVNFCVFIRPNFSGATYAYMAALSLADATTLLLYLPQGLNRCHPLYLSACSNESFRMFRITITYFITYVAFGVGNISETVSVWITVALSMERYLTMRYHHLSRTHCAPKNARMIIGAIVGAAIMLNLPMFFVLYISPTPRGVQSRLTSFGNSAIYSGYTWVRLIIVQFIPLLFLCIANALLLYLVKTATKRTSQTVSRINDRRLKAQRKLTALLIVVIGLFLCGQIPQAFAYAKIFEVLYPNCRSGRRRCMSYQYYRLTTQNLTFIAYTVNFFVYVTLNKHFRTQLREICGLSGDGSASDNHPEATQAASYMPMRSVKKLSVKDTNDKFQCTCTVHQPNGTCPAIKVGDSDSVKMKSVNAPSKSDNQTEQDKCQGTTNDTDQTTDSFSLTKSDNHVMESRKLI